jgi:hypothetical protein
MNNSVYSAMSVTGDDIFDRWSAFAKKKNSKFIILLHVNMQLFPTDFGIEIS